VVRNDTSPRISPRARVIQAPVWSRVVRLILRGRRQSQDRRTLGVVSSGKLAVFRRPESFEFALSARR